PTPTRMRIYSPAVTAGGGGTVKKTSAWSAGAVRKLSTAPMTARTPATFGLRNSSKTSPAIGINNPTVTKNAANARVRSSFIRVSNPSGVSRKPRMNPIANRTANIRSEFPKDFHVSDTEDIFSSPQPFVLNVIYYDTI